MSQESLTDIVNNRGDWSNLLPLFHINEFEPGRFQNGHQEFTFTDRLLCGEKGGSWTWSEACVQGLYDDDETAFLESLSAVAEGRATGDGLESCVGEAVLDELRSRARLSRNEPAAAKDRDGRALTRAPGLAGEHGELGLTSLSDFLLVPDEPVAYLIERLWPAGGNVLLAAKYKAGKTTLRDNMVRSLVDGDPFLGLFDIDQSLRRVAVLDFEMSENQSRAWWREQRIKNRHMVALKCLRGRTASTFDIRKPAVRTRWAEALERSGIQVVVVDCVRPILDALGLSEDKDGGVFLENFAALCAEAGVTESLVVHHMGHNGNRARGDTRFLDWPDAGWQLTSAHERAPRCFQALGRDVDQPAIRLSFEQNGRRLTATGDSVREVESSEDRAAGWAEAMFDAIVSAPGLSQAEVLTTVHGPKAETRAALKWLIDQGRVKVSKGANNKHCHHAVS